MARSYTQGGATVAAGTCQPCVAASSNQQLAASDGGPCFASIQNATGTGCGASLRCALPLLFAPIPYDLTL